MANLDLTPVEREPIVRRVIESLVAYQATPAAANFGTHLCKKGVVQSGVATILTQSVGSASIYFTVTIYKVVGTAAGVAIGTAVFNTTGTQRVGFTFTSTAVGEGDILYAATSLTGTTPAGADISVQVDVARDFS